MNKREKKILKKQRDKYKDIINANFSYLSGALSLSKQEKLMVELLNNEMDFIEATDLEEIIKAMKLNIKQGIKQGGHKNKLLQINFIWNDENDDFSLLTTQPNGTFKLYLDFLQDKLKDTGTLDTASKMMETCLKNFQEY